MRAPDATRRVLSSLLPPLAGVGLAAFTLLAAGAPKASDKLTGVGSARLEGTSAEDCAPCHAREVGEWSASAMAFAARSPLVGALESLVEEQVGRSDTCPQGAGVLRARGADACVDERTGVPVTGAGGEGWCIHCHLPGNNLGPTIPPWSAHGDRRAREPVSDLASPQALEGISCASCHATTGPVAAHAARSRGYEGNPTWTSFATGATFIARPEDAKGLAGIANSGYRLDAGFLLAGARDGARVHPSPALGSERYLASSEFCGACHDVRLFGTDVRSSGRGEHFKRLRNAYSEWRRWADAEAREGRRAPGCQECHMSLYPGVCAVGSAGAGSGADCPPGTHFEARAPGTWASGFIAPSSATATALRSHWFTSVDLPLSPRLADGLLDETALDGNGVPVGLRARRALLLGHTFRFEIVDPQRRGSSLQVPIVIENVGAGHRVPAGFSQEREIWVELRVLDARGGLVYEVGRLAKADADLGDKRLLRTTTRGAPTDGRGRPQGLFGADVIDGGDAPAWSPDPKLGGTRFAGRGLVNLQNGFQRCVRCIGTIDSSGRCQPGPDQGRTRADRFADGEYDLDTGECRSNLSGENALFETYLPLGSLDADRGVVKAPDAILDSRSAPPGVPMTFTYALDAGSHPGPFTVRARLLFRPFPPYLIRAFAEYERAQATAGLRPRGPQVEESMLVRDEPIEIGHAEATVL